MQHTSRYRDHTDEGQYEAPRDTKRTEVDPAEVAAMLDDINCCLADAEVVAEKVAQDDEAAAEAAFDALYDDYYDGRIGSRQEWKDKGSIIKARYAHTQYVQRERCCSCGCPWND